MCTNCEVSKQSRAHVIACKHSWTKLTKLTFIFFRGVGQPPTSFPSFSFCWLASLGISMVVTFLDPFGSRFPTAGLPLDQLFILDQLVIQEETK